VVTAAREAVEQDHASASDARKSRGHAEREPAVARADLGPRAQRLRGAREGGSDDRAVAHERVHAHEVPPAALRARILRVELVEPLGLDAARFGHRAHATSSSAPWQLNPAPNEVIHHAPPRAFARNARSRTKSTNGLLRLPYWRSTAALQAMSSLESPMR